MSRKDVECPYCGKWQEINHDDGQGYSEDKAHQQECSHCDKTFIFHTSIHYHYDVEKADCLNEGGEHNFEPTHRYPIVIFDKVCVRCSMCLEEKNIPYTDAVKYGYDEKDILKSKEEQDDRYNKIERTNDER